MCAYCRDAVEERGVFCVNGIFGLGFKLFWGREQSETMGNRLEFWKGGVRIDDDVEEAEFQL